METVLHPVRLHILEVVYGRQLTAKQIAQVVTDVPQTTLYRHLKLLVDSGHLTIAAERPIRGTVERVYAVGDSPRIVGPDEAGVLTTEDWMMACKAYIGSILGDFARYLHREGVDPVEDLVGMRKILVDMTRDEYLALIGELKATLTRAVAREAVPGSRRWVISLSMMPADPVPADPDSADNR
jgi:DNA-binding transcriptional ArsR family regulator